MILMQLSSDSVSNSDSDCNYDSNSDPDSNFDSASASETDSVPRRSVVCTVQSVSKCGPQCMSLSCCVSLLYHMLQ